MAGRRTSAENLWAPGARRLPVDDRHRVRPAIGRCVLAVFAAEPDRSTPTTPRLRAEAEAGFRELVEAWAPDA